MKGKYDRVLLTGSTGRLGSAILNGADNIEFLAPSRDEMNIENYDSVKEFFENNEFDAIIHCAALARRKDSHLMPEKAILTNIIGTANMVRVTVEKDSNLKTYTRFIHISTDGVYEGERGNYSESDPTIPYSKYGWTKLGAECSVNLLSNFCIIRTSFFDPEKIVFPDSAEDAFSSKMSVHDLVNAIMLLLNSDYIGTINVGDDKQSEYLRYKKYKHSMIPRKLSDIQKNLIFKLPRDSSLNCSIWNNLKEVENV